MQPKAVEKQRALSLRKQGKSLNEISRRLEVSKSSVSVWCRHVKLSSLQLDLLQKRRPDKNYGAMANKVKRAKQIATIRNDAIQDFRKLDSKETKRLRDIGTAIYWAEGAKRGNYVDLTNSDPKMVALMMNWFRAICQVKEEKFKISVFYHKGQNDNEMKKYWSEVTGVPLAQFHKSIFKKDGTGQRRNILYNGTCKVRVCDSDLLHRILAWIGQLSAGH